MNWQRIKSKLNKGILSSRHSEAKPKNLVLQKAKEQADVSSSESKLSPHETERQLKVKGLKLKVKNSDYQNERAGRTYRGGLTPNGKLSGSFYSLLTIHSSLLGKAKRWLKHHAKKLAMAGVSVVVALAMVVGFQPTTRAWTNSVTWDSKSDWDSGSGNKIDTSQDGYLKLGEDTANFSETFDNTTYKDAATTADWSGGQVQLSVPGWSNMSGGSRPGYNVFFTDANTGWIACMHDGFNFGQVLKTTDGGSSWVNKTPFGDSAPDYYGVHFINANTGWVVGYEFNHGYNIWKTTNGGDSWTFQTAPSGTSTLNSVWAFDANTAVAVGWSGKIIKTTNGGSNWYTQTSGTTSHLNDVWFVNSTTGWAVGENSTILKTTDGGSSWSPQSNSGGTLNKVYFLDANNGWVTSGSNNILLYTTDGGSTWNSKSTPVAGNSGGVWFTSTSIGWIAVYNISNYGIWKTTNGGDSWTKQYTTSATRDLYYIGSKGWAVGSLFGGYAGAKYDGGYQTSQNIAQSIKVNSGSPLITKATLTRTENNDSGASVSYQMSANGETNWENATPGSELTFANPGSDLRWKATLTGTSSATPRILDLSISYKYKYPASGSLSGLKADTGEGAAAKWTGGNLQWSYTTSNATNYYITYQTRTGNSWPLTSAWSSEYNLASKTANNWGSGISLSGEADGRYLELKINLYSTDNIDTPVLDKVMIQYNIPQANTLSQERVDSTSVGVGSYAKDLVAKLKMNGAATSTTIYPEVEVKDINTAFDGTTSLQTGSQVLYNGTDVDGSVTLSGLTNGTSYHWRARVKDTSGRISAWVAFGGNNDTPPAAADFIVDTTPPTQPGTPSTTTPTNDTTPTWTWTASTDTDSGLATTNTYKVYWDTVAGGTTYSAYSNTNSYTHATPLAEGTWYTKVYAYDNAGNESLASGNGQVVVDTSDPTDVSVSGYSDNSKTTPLTSGTWYNYSGANSPYFEWTAATDANGIAGYMVYFGTNASADPATDGSLQSERTYSPGSMTSGNTYYLKIKAKDNAGNYSSTAAEFIYKFDSTAPNAVADLSGTSIDTSTIRLSWSAPTDNVAVTGYTIERKKASENESAYTTVATLGAVTTHDDIGLEAGMTYNYRMKARDQAGNFSSYSNVATANTVDTVPPSAPTLSSVTALSDGFTINLIFTGAYDAVGIVGYKIERSKDASNWTEIKNLSTTETTNVPYQDNDTNNDANGTQRLTDNQIYYYRVRAYDQAYVDSSGTSGTISTYSNSNSATTPDVTAPTAPAGLSATPVSSSGIFVQWSTSSDKSRDGVTNGKGIVGYKIYQATSADGPWTTLAGTSSSNSFTDSGLDALHTYYYKVKAVDKAGSDTDINHASNNVSALSTETTNATTYTDAVPATPINTSATATQGDPTLNPNVGHQVQVSFTGAAASVVGGTSGHSLNHYEAYRYQGDIFPVPNPGGDGILTEAEFNSWVASSGLVKVGSDISVTSQTEGTRNSVTYQYLDDNSYSVYDNNLTDSQTYKYGVFVFDNTPGSNVPAGPFASGVSPVAQSTTPDVTAPDSPSDIEILDIFASLGSSNARVIITWTNIVQPADFKEYRLYRSTNGISYSLLTSTTDNYCVDGTVDETSTYYYKIVSADTTVNGGKNNESSGTVSAPVTPGQRDVVPPTLSSIQPSPGVSTATITWTTNEVTDSFVEYSLDTSYSEVAGHYDNATSHSVTLRGLSPDTTYHYRVRSQDQAGNPTTSAGSTFKTILFSVTSGPSVTAYSNTATITWQTNLASDSMVEYRASSDFNYYVAGSKTMSTSHSVTLNNLAPATIYYYKVKSEDSSGNKTESSGILAFSTMSTSSGTFGVPSVSRLAEAEVTATTVKIVWQTAINTTTWLDYGPTSSYGITLGDNVLNTTHMIVITGLNPGTTYHYRVRGKDIQGNEYVSADYTFQALAEPVISNITTSAISSYKVEIAFKTNIKTSSTINFGETAAYGQSTKSEDMLTDHSVTLTKLKDSATYHFQIEVKDQYGHTAKSADQTFETSKDTKGPKISNVSAKITSGRGEASEAMLIITWTTDERATTQVEYQAGAPTDDKYAKKTEEDEKLNLTHTEVIDGLKPSIAYHFRVVSKDKRDNRSYSKDYTALTPSKQESVLQLIIKSLEESFAWVSKVKEFIINKFDDARTSFGKVI